MNKETPKRLGRPPGSLNKKRPEETGTHTLITIPKALALKIATLSAKTGVHADRIALCALVDGLNKWQGIHEGLINYNESVDTIIRESGTGPARKRTRHAVAPSFTVSASPGDVVAVADTLGLEPTSATPRDNGADNPSAGATHLSPDDNALFGRGESEPGARTDTHFEQFIHGE